MLYIAAAIGAVIAGQVIVWSYEQANVYTALIAVAIGLVADGIALQVIFFVIAFNDSTSTHQHCIDWSALVVLHSCHRWTPPLPGIQVIVHS